MSWTGVINLLSTAAFMICPPAASPQLIQAIDLPSGDQAGSNSPTSAEDTRRGVPLGRSIT